MADETWITASSIGLHPPFPSIAYHMNSRRRGWVGGGGSVRTWSSDWWGGCGNWWLSVFGFILFTLFCWVCHFFQILFSFRSTTVTFGTKIIDNKPTQHWFYRTFQQHRRLWKQLDKVTSHICVQKLNIALWLVDINTFLFGSLKIVGVMIERTLNMRTPDDTFRKWALKCESCNDRILDTVKSDSRTGKCQEIC